MKVIRFKSREDWLANRGKGLGGSEIAAVLGMSPYPDSNPMSVWLTKTGTGGTEREVTPQMEWGTRHEAALKEKFQESHPELTLGGLGPWDVYSMDDFPWASCTPDDLIDDDGMLEVKAPGFRQSYRWGDTESDEVPVEYLLQCQWNMGVCGRKYCYLVALIGGSDYREYKLVFDPDLFATMLEKATEFWSAHVATCIPPELDGSEPTRAYLSKKYPYGNGEMPVVTSNSALSVLDDYARVDSAIKVFTRSKDLLKNRIIEIIGENDGVLWPGGKVTYKRPKDSETTDWKLVCGGLEDLLVNAYEAMSQDGPTGIAEARAIIASTIKDCTTTKVNSRRFLPTIKEGYVGQIESAGAPELPGSENSAPQISGGEGLQA